MVRVLVNVPKTVQRGELFEIKVLISHPMESGQRRDEQGEVIPRKIIKSFVASWGQEEIMSADFFPAIAANPFLAFSARAEASGTLSLTWVDDDDHVQTELVAVTVT